MTTTRAGINSYDACEYFCHACGQLRLWVVGEPEKRGTEPTKCENCNSENIQLGVINDPTLTKLKHDWKVKEHSRR